MANNRFKRASDAVNDQNYHDSDNILSEADWRRIASAPASEQPRIREEVWGKQPIHNKLIKRFKNIVYDDIQDQPVRDERYQRLRRTFK